MDPEPRATVLCVDDEPQVLEGISLHLRRRYEVVTARSGAAGLEILARDPSTAVVLSDMRMPVMDGARFLSRAREVSPHTVRLLLTGETDISAAIAAVNDGQIFRFLTKPCPPPTLVAAVAAGVEQHRLLTAERVLLEQTLQGSLKAMTDILALANPLTFGRALRIKQHTSDLCEAMKLVERWQIEVAAMFSQLGLITLPAETVEKVYTGGDLNDSERAMVERLPAVTERLLGQIPRLEVVRSILNGYAQPFRPCDPTQDSKTTLVRRGSHVLRVTVDFDVLEAHGNTPARALATMRGRAGTYDPAMLDAFGILLNARGDQEEMRELPLSALRAGMVLADDVRLVSGPMLVARGYEVTHRFVERANNFPPGSVREPVRVILRQAAARP